MFWYCDNCETIWHRDSADTCWICDGQPSPVADDFVYTSPGQGNPLNLDHIAEMREQAWGHVPACPTHYPKRCTCE